MDTITRTLGNDHKHCDELFIAAESAVTLERWEIAAATFAQFAEAMHRHLAKEEQVLFPAFEQTLGSSAGPTAVMRIEHEQMRDLLQLLQEALHLRDTDAFLGSSDTLNTMMQQHNMKEEGMLYPMSDRVLSARCDEIIDTMRRVGSGVAIVA